MYHIAVANNASLVWYLHKRFSEFLALHAALSGNGSGGGSEGFPRDRCLSVRGLFSLTAWYGLPFLPAILGRWWEEGGGTEVFLASLR